MTSLWRVDCADYLPWLASLEEDSVDLLFSFPERLAEFFVRSFCPPGGLVCDPFAGSGTTLAVAVASGRRALGCDIRLSQVENTRRRLAGVTPTLFPQAST